MLWMLAAVTVAIQAPGTSSAKPSTAAPAQLPPGVTRNLLQRNDLGTKDREAIQVRVDFGPGAVFPRHVHPGEEIVYVLKGTLEYRLDRQPRVTLNAGDTLFIPSGTIHAVENVGLESASEVATYVVEKGKPLITLIK